MKTIQIKQNVDRAIAARDYRDFGSKILITSVFSTIQGEGPFAGRPAMFVRLAGCNYGNKGDMCSWCDTSFEFDNGTLLEPEALLKMVMKAPGYNNRQVLVITGGEPTLQLNLLSFIVIASEHFADIQLETNGTQPKFYTEALARNMMHLFKSVVSPKANEHLGKYPPVHKDVMWWATCYKFVVTADPTSPHHTIPEWAWALATHKDVYVSPMAVYSKEYHGEVASFWDDGLIDRQQTAKNYHYAAVYAMKHRLRLSLQTHLLIGLA